MPGGAGPAPQGQFSAFSSKGWNDESVLGRDSDSRLGSGNRPDGDGHLDIDETLETLVDDTYTRAGFPGGTRAVSRGDGPPEGGVRSQRARTTGCATDWTDCPAVNRGSVQGCT